MGFDAESFISHLIIQQFAIEKPVSEVNHRAKWAMASIAYVRLAEGTSNKIMWVCSWSMPLFCSAIQNVYMTQHVCFQTEINEMGGGLEKNPFFHILAVVFFPTDSCFSEGQVNHPTG